MSVNHKNLFFFITWMFLSSWCFGKQLYLTRDGEINFFSSTPIEDIKAVNSQVSCVLNKITGDFAFQVPIKGFRFKNALMQEHFNENYLESDLYPKSVFKGKISDWENIDISSKPADVTIEGELTIHGVKKSIKESGRIWYNEDKISGQCKFNIAVADYNIKIPRIVRENIAEIIEVSVNVTLKRK